MDFQNNLSELDYMRFRIAYKDSDGYMDYTFFYAEDSQQAEDKFLTRYPELKILETYLA